MRGLNQRQRFGIDLLLNQHGGLQTLSEDILEKEVIVKDMVLEVAKVGRDSDGGCKHTFPVVTRLSR